MRYLPIIFIFLFSFSLSAQKKELYYDYTWKPCPPENARFYSLVEKTDSGWFRRDYFLGSMTLQMQALYADSACKVQNGDCYYFHANGKASAVGRLVNDKEEGLLYPLPFKWHDGRFSNLS